ncbi:MAG TPA: PLP-dependent aminotransferase family protein [Bryobacteraceae bacterium]|nr:PLP-dependent aminotransferase family protein [Bryobacteraceae bacterium]
MLWLVPLPDTPPRLDSDSTEPLYRQLGLWLREQISSGRLRRGERLPATRDMAERLSLNRATIASAYALLEAEGLLAGHVGKGSFVANVPEVRRGKGWDAWTAKPAESVAPPNTAIRFDSSRPSEDLFPLDEFRASCQEVLAGRGAAQVLQLGSPQGLPALREYLLSEAIQQGAAGPQDDVLVTSGCQQAMDLIERLVTADGDARIAIEDPVYPGVRNVFGKGRTRLSGVPVDEGGMDLGVLETVLDRQRPKLLVATPSFQNPTGWTMPETNRRTMVAMARRAGVLLVESGIYADLRYVGTAAPALRTMDHDSVLQLGSFSKLAFPGLRVGWVLGPRPVIARLTQIRHWCDLHSDQLSQSVLLHFARSGRLERHRKKMLQHGGRRLQAVLDACEEHLPPGSRWTRPEGGMSLWAELPGTVDTALALEDAQRAGVSYLPGRAFAVERPAANSLRLSFAGETPARIEEGLRILGRVFREHADRRFSPVAEVETAVV